jgi:hypothetical protein
MANFAFFTLVDLVFFLVLIISTSISIFIFRSISVSGKPFHKIYSAISSPEIKQDEKIKLIEGLHDYLDDYSEEQILFHNLEFFKKEGIFWYDIYFALSFSIIAFLTLGSNLPDIAKVFLIFLANTLIRLLAESTIYFFLCRKIGMCHMKTMHQVHKAINLAKKNTLIILNSLILFYIFSSSFILFIEILREGEPTVQFFNLTISEIRAYDIGSIGGNRFSLSALFFTLAISGTVVFSIINTHLKHKRKINEELNKQITTYENWYKEYEKILSIKLEDIFNKTALISFYKAVDVLSIKLGVKDFKMLKAPTRRFYSQIVLIFISFFTAIFTVIAPSSFINYIFLFFIICCGSFILNAYKIFKDYTD